MNFKKSLLIIFTLATILFTSSCIKDNKYDKIVQATLRQGKYSISMENVEPSDLILYSNGKGDYIKIEKMDIELNLISKSEYENKKPINVFKIDGFYYEVSYKVKFSNDEYKTYQLEKGFSNETVYYSTIIVDNVTYLYRVYPFFSEDQFMMRIRGMNYSYKLLNDEVETPPLESEVNLVFSFNKNN